MNAALSIPDSVWTAAVREHLRANPPDDVRLLGSDAAAGLVGVTPKVLRAQAKRHGVGLMVCGNGTRAFRISVSELRQLIALWKGCRKTANYGVADTGTITRDIPPTRKKRSRP